MDERRFKKRTIFLCAYLLFAILPVYWMINMSFKTNDEILGAFSMWPRNFTFDNFRTILTDASWYSGYINSMIYVAINTVISLAVALPAAYAFSRYSFLGDKHVFFWLLTNRMTPPAVFSTTVFSALLNTRFNGYAYCCGVSPPCL
jgi:glycerol transport system permease protein